MKEENDYIVHGYQVKQVPKWDSKSQLRIRFVKITFRESMRPVSTVWLAHHRTLSKLMHSARTSKQKQTGNHLSYTDITIPLPLLHLLTDNIILQQHPTLIKPRSQVLPTTPQQAKPAQPRRAVHARVY